MHDKINRKNPNKFSCEFYYIYIYIIFGKSDWQYSSYSPFVQSNLLLNVDCPFQLQLLPDHVRSSLATRDCVHQTSPTGRPFFSLLPCPRSVMSAIVTHFPPIHQVWGVPSMCNRQTLWVNMQHLPQCFFHQPIGLKTAQRVQRTPSAEKMTVVLHLFLAYLPSQQSCSDSNTLLFQKYPEIVGLFSSIFFPSNKTLNSLPNIIFPDHHQISWTWRLKLWLQLGQNWEITQLWLQLRFYSGCRFIRFSGKTPSNFQVYLKKMSFGEGRNFHFSVSFDGWFWTALTFFREDKHYFKDIYQCFLCR